MQNTQTMNQQSQSQTTPDQALEKLLEGNKRFVSGSFAARDYSEQVNVTQNGQFPFAVVLSCVDSRVPAETVFDQGIGDIFSARVAGNVLNEDVLGSIEFACKLAGSKLIVVLGHTSCGAVKGACNKAEMGYLTQLLAKIEPAIDSVPTEPNQTRDSSNIDFVNRVSQKNVALVCDEITTKSDVLSAMVQQGDIKIVGAMYDVRSGAVHLVD